MTWEKQQTSKRVEADTSTDKGSVATNNVKQSLVMSSRETYMAVACCSATPHIAVNLRDARLSRVRVSNRVDHVE